MAPSVSPSEHVLHPEKTSSVRVPNSSQRADFGDSGLFSYFEIAVHFPMGMGEVMSTHPVGMGEVMRDPISPPLPPGAASVKA